MRHLCGEAERVTDWIIRLMEQLGGPGAGLAVALENVFPPIPSELVLPLAGFTASRGVYTLPAAIGWTTLGSVVGALILYGLGRRLGHDRVRRLADKLPLIDLEDVDKTNAWFSRHGSKAVFFGRMLPVFRSLISIPAGAEQMPWRRFVLLTAAGSLVWNSALILAGYFLGNQWQDVQRYTGAGHRVLLVAGGGAVVWFVVKRVRRNRQRAATG